MASLHVPQGRFLLERYPHRAKSTLRAWDAADELVLGHLATAHPVSAHEQWLVVNDSYGALAVGLSSAAPTVMSDSLLSQRGTAQNLGRNGLPPAVAISTLDPPPPRVDVLVVKVPKTLALLEDQLHRIRPALHGNTAVVGAGMTKRIHSSTLALFERLVGPTTTSLATKKARLIFSRLDPGLEVGDSPYPTSYTLPSGHRVVNHANVFSRARLDPGTRLLLGQVAEDLGAARVVDLGCGAGVIGLTIALRSPDAQLTLVDESFMAVASAQATFAEALGTHDHEIVAAIGLEGVPDASVDLVMCNPPFHEDRAVGDATAWEMFLDARRALVPDGRLLVVGNRHLRYHAKLKRIFGNCDVVASDPKYVVAAAVR